MKQTKSKTKTAAKKTTSKTKPHPAVKKVTFTKADEKRKSDPNDLSIPDFLKREEGAKPSTKQIQIRAMNLKAKVLGHTERAFTTVEAARAYLREMSDGKDIVTSSSKDGMVATINEHLQVVTNYDVRRIMKGVEPEGLLHPFHNFGAKTIPWTVGSGQSGTSERKEALSVPKATPKSASGTAIKGGKVVVLKHLCQELKIEPRKARAKLRAAKKAGKLPREADGARWQWAPEEAEQVRAILSK